MKECLSPIQKRAKYNKKYWKIWYAKNRKLHTEHSNTYYLENRDKRIAYARAYGKENKEKQRYWSKRYRKNHKEKYRIVDNLRSRLRTAIKGKTKSGSAVRDLGCTISELKFYLEGKFTDGMTWQNHGEWHIDHIIPLAFYDLSDIKQLEKACHYTNLQPLWARENLSKGKRILTSIKQYAK